MSAVSAVRAVRGRRACDSAKAMATRKMDALFPQRKSSVPSGVKSSKVLSAASSKSGDPVFRVHHDVGSGGGSVGAADSQPAALVSAAGKDLNEGQPGAEKPFLCAVAVALPFFIRLL